MDKNWTVEDTREGPEMVVTGQWNRSARRAFKRGRFTAINLNYARGFQERSLAFLEGLPIRRLKLLARTITDLTPIYALAGTLESLNIVAGSRAVVDLSRLTRLKAIAASWPAIAESLPGATGLDDVYIGEFDDTNLYRLRELTALTTLRFNGRPRITSLAGVEVFSKLSILEVASAGSLTDISQLDNEGLSKSLVELDLTQSKKFGQIDPMAALTSLRRLNISECGAIDSLRPLVGLKELEEVFMWGSTRVLDGNLSPLLTLPKLRTLAIQDRRAYGAGKIAVKDAISTRN